MTLNQESGSRGRRKKSGCNKNSGLSKNSGFCNTAGKFRLLIEKVSAVILVQEVVIISYASSNESFWIVVPLSYDVRNIAFVAYYWKEMLNLRIHFI